MICAERVKSFRFLAVFSDFERREKRLCFYNKGNSLLFFGSHQSQSVSQYYTRVLKTHRDTQKESFCFFQKICRITGRGVALFFQEKNFFILVVTKKKKKIAFSSPLWYATAAAETRFCVHALCFLSLHRGRRLLLFLKRGEVFLFELSLLLGVCYDA